MPTRDTAWPAGTPCWVDYSAADIDAAKRFYADVVGWDYTEGRPEFGGYLTAQTRGLGAAGLMPKMAPSQPSAWTTYFATDDAEATASAIAAAGGTVVAGPHDVGALGKMVVAIDQQGMAFGAWQAGEHTGVEIYNEPGGLVWNEAAAPDPQAARDFYGKVFGFRFDPIPEAGDYYTFSVGDAPLGGIGGHSPGTPQGWYVYFSVANADAAVAAAEAAGGKVRTGAHDTPYGRHALVEDPWAATFSVMQELSS
jgi:predicted enzyme related to lactoylglutathione lyase